ncbi:MAG TPA: transketolase [Hyphomicrobiaceae bacterium]|nr:transketolase [Hyphomicrobiaceae bacterium]
MAHPSPAAQPSPGIDERCIDTIRTLAMDAVQQAKSGHPGTPMALAPLIYSLWQRILRFDPEAPLWPNRDRFVLSNGHASMLLYAVLYLAGVKPAKLANGRQAAAVSLEDIKRFRQIGSVCPGHPEYGLTAGVETTTGPLGQGCGNSVGMALAGRWLGQRYNRPGAAIFDYRVYAICSDGDMMEGVASEAASFAGHQRLGNLCWIYDSNHITIEGHTDLAFSEEVAGRFRAYGWQVAHVGDVNDGAALARALEAAKTNNSAPSLIIVNSHIGFGAPHKQDTSAAHGEPLGEEEVRLAKRSYGWPEDAKFLVPDGVREHFAGGCGARGRRQRQAWDKLWADYRRQYPDLAAQIGRIERGDLAGDWDAALPTFAADAKGMATRDSSGKVLNAIAAHFPWLIGGSADLAPSTKTHLSGAQAGELEAASPGGRNLHFGVREHAMGAILSGLSLSGLRAFGATFLIFSDYMKASIRLAALMELPVVYVFTHDSIGVGEDGPTHQPIEQLVGLRSIPGLLMLRPADANEVVEAWRTIMTQPSRPACLALSRQVLPTIDRSRYAAAAGLARGAYVLADSEGAAPEVILIGTGSEVALCLAAHERLAGEGVKARVVSMPSWELFEEQDQAYRDRVLPPEVTARVSVEMGAVIGWDRYVGRRGHRIGMRSFGASAPLKDLLHKFGFTVEAVAAAATDQLAKSRTRTAP